MNQLQIWILRLGLLTVLFLLLFPPWLYPSDSGIHYHTGYTFILHPPKQCLQGNIYNADEGLMQIDGTLLFMEVAVTVLIVLLLISFCGKAFVLWFEHLDLFKL